MYRLIKYFIIVARFRVRKYSLTLKLLIKKPPSRKHEEPSQILNTHLKEKQDTLVHTCDHRFWEVETAGLLGTICQQTS